MELLDALLDRTVIVSLAVAGAVITTAGSLAGKHRGARMARLAVRLGYGLAGTSVVLFIVAGFRAAYA